MPGEQGDEHLLRPLVSVVTRTRDRPALLSRALGSIAAQQYRPIEVVIVNDGGSPSEVTRVVAETLDETVQLRRVDNDQSVGREQALNVGVGASTGALVTVLDDDDTWDRALLASVVPVFADPQVMGVVVRAAVVSERVVDGELVEVARESLATDLTAITLAELIEHNVIPTNAFTYRREAYDELGGYDGSLPVLADWDFNVRFAARFPIELLPGRPLAQWHHRKDGAGAELNSVFSSDDHEHYRRVLRDRHLRETLKQPGLQGVVETVALESIALRGRIGDLERQLTGALQAVEGLRDQMSMLAAQFEALSELSTRRSLAHIDDVISEIREVEQRTVYARTRRTARRALNAAQRVYRELRQG